jgi:hypothetical protein
MARSLAAGLARAAAQHGRPGRLEFIGPWQHAAAVKESLLKAGEEFGLVQVGALSRYYWGNEI